MADQAQFEGLLQTLLSAENQSRSQAEESYEGIPVPAKLQFLLTSMKNGSVSIEARTLATVLLRKVFTSNFEEFWPQLGADAQNLIKAEILSQVQNESTQAVRRKICEALSELVRNLLDDNGNNTWPESLRFLFESANSPDAGLKECALHIFGSVPGIFGNQQTHYLDVIKQMLQQCIHDQVNARVRFEAVRAATSFLIENEKDAHLHAHLKDLLPGIIQGVAQSAESQDDDALLKCLVDIAETVPKYLRNQLEHVIDLCMKISSNANVLDSWRHLALEVIVTLSETAPAMLRKFGVKFIPILVPQILALMVDLEDDPEWAFSDEIEEEDNDSNAIAGESALDRLACGLGGKTILPHILSNVPQMLQNDDWRYRHAALMAISACGEGCHKQMEGMLGSVVEAVLPYLQDPHPRVRYAACNAVGQMSTDFGPVFQKKFHEKVVPGLLVVMDDYKHPRVQVHAGAALVNFSEDCPKNILIPYLDQIITKLEEVLNAKFKELLEKGTKLVLEQVVTTLASVADTAEEKFCLYYERFMPSLKYIMQNAINPELKLLRGKTIECISLIGLAVGQEKFMQDCSEVMQLLLKTQMDEGEMAEDDPQMSYMISAWARMCKIMGKDFEQYLPLVMGPVLKAASIKPEVAVVDNEDMKSLEGDQDWQFVTLGDQQSFGIRTAGLEEKATACQMLVCYARELKEGFAEYTEQVVKIMVPLLKFYFNDECRVAAAESLPFLIDCARIKGEQYMSEMWSYICPNLLKSIETEPEKDILAEIMHSLSQFILNHDSKVRVAASESMPFLIGCALTRGQMFVREMWLFMCPELLKAMATEPEHIAKAAHFESFAQCIEKLGVGCLNDQQFKELGQLIEKQMAEHFDRQSARQEQRKDEDYDEVVEESLLDEDDEDVYILSKISDVMHALFGTHKELILPFFDTLLPNFVKLLGEDRPWPDRQWGLCIWDDVIEHVGPAALKYQEYFLHSLIKCLQDNQPEVRQAAFYGVGAAAQFGGPGYYPIFNQALPALVTAVDHPESRSVENIAPTENAISAVAKICKFAPDAVNVNDILPHWLSWLPTWEDTDEAEYIYGYLCDLIESNHPLVVGENIRGLLGVFGEALAKEALQKDSETAKRVANIIRQMQAQPTMYHEMTMQLTAIQLDAIQRALGAA